MSYKMTDEHKEKIGRAVAVARLGLKLPPKEVVTTTKRCLKCGERKPVSKFHKKTQNKDGFFPYCASCDNLRERAWLKNNADEYKPKKREKDRIIRKSEKWKKRRKEYERNNPQKNIARQQLRHAVRMGKIVRLPCCVCGNKPAQGHHENYNKPLDVVWLCQKHHTERHYPSP